MYAHILVGTDGSATAERAVDRAVQVAGVIGAALAVLGVGPERQVGPIVERSASTHDGSGVEITTITEQGDPASVILDVAESGNYDLLVVGNRGMTGATRLFLGSVPNKVSHHTPCHLLIVHTT